MNRILCTAFAAAWLSAQLAQPAWSQTRDDQVASLAFSAVPIRSIDPVDEDFADLEPLREVLGSARVVLLGEQSHGDGATFHAKARLVRFLHQEMGFDVLAFESGFYECEVAESRLAEGEDAHTAVRRCVFPIWTESTEFQPTIDYLQEARSSERPLHMAGFDSQMTGSAATEFLLSELRERADEAGADFDWSTYGEVLDALVEDRYRGGAATVLPIPREEVRNAFDSNLMALARDLAESALDDREYWSQVIRSFAAHARAVWMTEGGETTWAYAAVRDHQMAENLLWHLEQRHAGRKVIAWAASLHVSRNLPLVELPGSDPPNLYADFLAMGHHLEDALGSEAYAIGFLAHEGEWGTPWMPPQPLPRGAPPMLEAILADAGFDRAFLDLRSLDASTGWLEAPTPSRPFGYAPMIAPWAEVMDGIFFTREMTPSTRWAP